jgi:hypothetical protein
MFHHSGSALRADVTVAASATKASNENGRIVVFVMLSQESVTPNYSV